MPSERIQRQIDRLLDEAEAALAQLDWATVRARAEAALALDPENGDAVTFRDAATRGASNAAAPSAVAEAPAASAQERRQVTVFFSDLSGFTSLSERLDPEDVRDIVNKVWARADEIVRRYDGRINKLLGDAVMAVFGDPVAHEDDPVRAVRAALELHEAVDALNRDVEKRIGSPIGMHSGVNTGVVLTSESVLDGKQTGPLGDTINVAARLQSLAQTGQVLVGPETRRAIEHAFDLENLGAHDLKGKGEPVQVARVVTVAARQVTPARRSGRFVGRDAELSVLRDEWDRARKGVATFVALSGEAGAGKSRLVEEFRTRIAADATWLEGRAYPFAQNIPYYPVTDLLSSRLGIDETDSPETVRRKLEDRVTALVGDDAPDVIPPLLQLYDIEGSQGSSIDREVYKDRLQQAVRTLVQRLAARGPLVICLQDLHWAHPSTIELLRTLATADLAAAMTLYNYRPEFSFHEGGIREIRLTELSDRDTRDLVEALLESRDVPEALVSFLEERTSGNPFFVEEIVNGLLENRTLIRESGAWTLSGQFDATSVPTTIRGVIASRIDRLDAERRAILQEASVIGREFLFTILSEVRGTDNALADALGDLESADLIRRRDVDVDLEYLFKHALTQEVAYSGLLRSKRQELHRRVGLAMEQLLGERSREYAESIAYHFQNSDTTARAVPYLIVSGKKAIERYALAEAETMYRAAYEILLEQQQSPQREHDLLGLLNEWALLLYYTGDIHAFRKQMDDHKDLLQTVSDAESRGMWLVWHCFVSYASLDFAAGFAYGDQAVALGEECRSPRVVAYALTQMTWALALHGRTRDAAAAGERALSLVDALTDERDATYVRFKAGAGVALAYGSSGDLIKSRAYATQVLDLASRSGSRRGLSMGHYVQGLLYATIGERARSLSEFAIAFEAAPDPIYRAVVVTNYASNLMFDGQNALARGITEASLASSERNGLVFESYLSKANLALLTLAEGDPGRGLDQLEAVARDAEERQWPFMCLVMPMTMANVYARIATGEAKGSLATALRNPSFVLGRGRRAPDIARSELTRLSENLSPDFEGYRLVIDYTLAQVLVKRKDYVPARAALQRALAFLQPMGDCPGARDAQALLDSIAGK